MMNVLSNRHTVDQRIREFIRGLKHTARAAGQHVPRKGIGYVIDAPVLVFTPAEDGSMVSHRVILIEISGKEAVFITNYFLADKALVLMQLSGDDGVPARVKMCKKNGDQYRVALDFVREYDHEVNRLVQESVPETGRQLKGLLAWLMG